MARGARHAAAVRAAIAALQADAPAHHMPALTQLVFHVPHKLDNPRLWYAASFPLTQGPHAPPTAQGGVRQPAGGRAGRPDAAQRGDKRACALWYAVHTHAANMPERTIVLGDKPASEILRELRTMGRFAHEQR